MNSEAFDPLVRVRNLLLLSILRNGEISGHKLKDLLSDASDGFLAMATAPLYKTLRRLEDRGLVCSESRRQANNCRTRLYRLTPVGSAQFESEWRTWNRFTSVVASIVDDPGHPAEPSIAKAGIRMEQIRPLISASYAG
jgi:DNA-binding PadR family transcriptional regulator